MLTGGYDDLDQIHHDAIFGTRFLPPLAMPQAPFTLSSSSLGLLLGACRDGLLLRCC
jgi:hypothetical protein